MRKNKHFSEIPELREKIRQGDATGDEIRRCRALMVEQENSVKWKERKRSLIGVVVALLILAFIAQHWISEFYKAV